ncbi:hypothetical protein D9M68_825370 [compost metagenome]
MLFARPFYSEKVNGQDDVDFRLEFRRPSGTLSSLYRDRPDLIGRPFHRSAAAKVNRTNFDLIDADDVGHATISIHQYALITRNEELSSVLIEVQPFCRGSVIPRNLPAIFRPIVRDLEGRGFLCSPTSKYHRIPRARLEH